ncbi:ABC transporter ATP-binding protein [Actinotalea ferrariae CF5-4]|uniref:ABC transporter ATP-binding protein n=1 Tax=Actinotalea ferrariae CF5-4 TaxID=948458 RepID=A0A021VYU2_9CELL|nr:ABC transporter ATP-binding protein [Actinotalea ferrariae]EYR65190.1 ABC transporter ATP-binding protein [Actinotalea ferrariae CF5-4]
MIDHVRTSTRPGAGDALRAGRDDDVPVRVRGVTRRFDATVALDDVTLDVHRGEIVGLLGPNGAGKTTLLSLVSGVRRPDAGTVRLFGRDPRDAVARVRLGTTPQETGLPATLRVGEIAAFVAGHYPDPMPVGELLETFGLTDLARRQTGGLSGGQKRRLAVALALAGRPDLVLLDEPTTGLDVDARHVLWDALREFHSRGVTVVVTSHYLEEIEALAERVVVVDHGLVLADGTLRDVVGRVALRRVTLSLDDDGGAPGASSGPARLDALTGVVRRDTDPATGRHVLLTPDADALVRELVTAGVPFHDLEVRSASLEEAFLSLTREEVAA